MKWLPLLWAALRRKPLRSVLTLLSIMVAFSLVGIMSGLNASFAQLIDESRVDRIIVSARYGVWFPLAHVDQIAQLNGVTDIVPAAFIQASYQDPNNGLFLRMTDARTAEVRPEFGVAPELFAALERVRDGLIVTRATAERFGWSEGDQIPFETDRVYQDGSRNWTFTLAGIAPDNEKFPMGFSLGNFIYLNEGRADGRVNDIHEIALLIDDPERAGEVSTAIEQLFANSPNPVIAMSERTLNENNIRGVLNIQFFTYAVSAAALFMILFLTGNVMAQSVRERIPEFAVMKTVGFSDGGVCALVLTETVLLCLSGAGLGLLLSAASPILVEAVVPGGPVPIITVGVVVFAIGCAILVAMISGLPAAWRVTRISIADALGGR